MQHISKITKPPKVNNQDKSALFLDEDFPPVKESLGVYEVIPELQEPRWKRISELNAGLEEGQACVLFSQDAANLRIQDIQESGSLGTKSLIWAAKLLIEKSPSILKGLFTTDALNDVGVYQLRFFVNGEQKTISIDENLPFDSNEAFAQSYTNQEYWLPILEKAWAKLAGSYERSSTFHTLDVLKHFTNAPQSLYHHDLVEPEDIWKHIHTNTQQSNIVFASSGQEKSTAEGHTQGAQVFLIYDSVELPITKDNKVRLIRMRDLNDKTEWTGDWSEKSDKWQDEDVKAQLDYANVYANNQYYMSFDDYISYYNSTCISKVHYSKHAPFIRETLKLSHVQDSFAAARFQVQHQAQKVYLSLHQVSKKLVLENELNYEVSKARVIVGRLLNQQNQRFEYVRATFGTTEDLILELSDVPEGRYIVYLEVEWTKPDLVHSFVLSSYSDQQLDLEAVDKEEHFKNGRFTLLEDLMKANAIRNDKRKTFYENQKGAVKSLYRVIAMNDGQGGDIGYVYYSNFKVSSDQDNLPTLEEKLAFKDVKALKIAGLHENQELDVKVRPEEDTIFIIRKVGNEAASYKVNSFPRLVYEVACTPQDVRERGKKMQLSDETSGTSYNCFMYILQHDDGFAFLIENGEQDRLLLLKLNLNTENLIEKGINQPPSEWKFNINPNESLMKELIIGDITKKTSLKYSLNFKIYSASPIEDEAVIAEQCKTRGQRNQIEFNGQKYQIHFANLMIDDKQYWYFENLESEKEFEGTFTLKLQNIEDDSGQNEFKWQINILAGQPGILKKLHLVDPFSKCSVSYTTTYIVK